ncbi:hypothetical protein BV20DRAFT_1112621 [Pilatotrama ljubarskyi]|nr:hypothetical protein BV20DRAFT_1112621 [Pilatotrama ljubarskyi]
MLKRPRDVFDTPDSSSPPAPATKRRNTISSSSLAASSPSSSAPPLSALSTPYSLPYFRSPYTQTIPHDSPSNPFGLNRALRALTLPRPTGFSKHIVLRMQLVSTADPTGARSRRTSPSDTPYRIVQVPLNYSFRLLHMLLLFLFASDARLRIRRRKRAPTRDLRTREASSSSRKPKSPSETSENGPEAHGEGHLFEVFEGIRIYTNTYRPGVIKSGTGKLYARLSSTRERKLFPDDQPAHAVDDVFGDGGMAEENGDEDEDGWDWEAEDDFLLSNVWTDGPNLKKGIIYHHTPSTAIHITVNQTRVPPRKGIGNAPHVFAARGGTGGAVRIANVASAPAAPSSSTSKPSSSTRASKSNNKGKRRERDDSDSSSGSDFSSSSDEERSHERNRPYVYDGDEVPDLGPREEASEDALERWNAHNAFDRFLKREAARERGMRREALPASAAAVGVSRAARGSGKGYGVAQSSPLKPRASGTTTHRYGHRHASAGMDGVDAHADMGGADGADALPPSSPSTLPLALPPSDCDALWTDTDCSAHSSGAQCARRDRPDMEEQEQEEAREHMRYMIELPLQTPFPAHPAVRRRVRRASERIERQVWKGLGEMEVDEEEELEGEGKEGKEGGNGKEKAARKGKENATAPVKAKTAEAEMKATAGAGAATQRVQPQARQERRPAAQTKAKPAAAKARPVVAPPTPESDTHSHSTSGSDSGTSSSHEDGEGGYDANGAPWLHMRGPEDGSSEGTGGWDSDEV